MAIVERNVIKRFNENEMMRLPDSWRKIIEKKIFI